MIQKEYGYSDRELVEQIKENPYYQYFIGLPQYQDEAPFVPSLLVEFRKRISDEILIEVNEMIVKHNDKSNKNKDGDDDENNGGNTGSGSDQEKVDNNGTLILYDTTRSSIALSIMVMNLNLMVRILLRFFMKMIKPLLLGDEKMRPCYTKS